MIHDKKMNCMQSSALSNLGQRPTGLGKMIVLFGLRKTNKVHTSVGTAILLSKGEMFQIISASGTVSNEFQALTSETLTFKVL